MDAPTLRLAIEAFLDGCHVMSLASVAPDGTPHAASLFYARDGLSLVWTSATATRHSGHVEAGTRVGATVAPDYDDFRAIRGVQLWGSARRLRDETEVARARDLMRQRYPFLGQLAAAPLALQAAIGKAGYYRLEPERITLIDNTRGFGHKDTLRVRDDGTLAIEE